MIRDVKTVILNDSDIFHLPFNTLEHNNVMPLAIQPINNYWIIKF